MLGLAHSGLNNNFAIDPTFNPELFFKYSIGITAYDGQPQNVIFTADKVLSKYLLSQPLHHTQEIKEVKEGAYTFSYFLLPSYELKMVLLGFGEGITVLNPQSLANDIQSTANKINNLYK